MHTNIFQWNLRLLILCYVLHAARKKRKMKASRYPPRHKKACKKRAAEIYDEQLFREVELEECPICFLLMPLDNQESFFKLCCGKSICNGCIHEMMVMEKGADLCPFCREPRPSHEEGVKLTKKLMGKGNAYAFYMHALSQRMWKSWDTNRYGKS